MLADSVNSIMLYIDRCKKLIIDNLESKEDDLVIIIPKSMLSEDLNLTVIRYSYSMQINLICEYIQSHDLNDILNFLELIVATGNIRYKDVRVSALESVVSSVKKVLSMDIS